MPIEHVVAGTTPEDMRRGREWVGTFLSAAEHLPISFLYDGQRISGIPSAWAPVRTVRRVDAVIVETLFTATDPRTGLQLKVEGLQYADYPVVEWTAWLTNTGAAPTPVISDLVALDAAFAGTAPLLSHCNGDFYGETGYTPEETPLPEGSERTFAPTGGRACDGAFPYYRVAFEGCGLTLAVGWPAQWSASFKGMAGGVSIRAGQETTHFHLLPGETVRTPRITILAWMGDQERAINLWRRWYLAHVLPAPGRPAVAAAGGGRGYG